MNLEKIKTGSKKAFTLIELLVVITIIGILATGATAVYTSQIQKARDTTRINDLEAFKSGLEQIFQDAAEYPEGVDKKRAGATCDTSVSGYESTFSVDCVTKQGYMAKLPSDPKAKQIANGSALDYIYAVGPVNSVVRQSYEISTGFENEGNKTGKARKDDGGDNNRLEMGVGISTIGTSVSRDNTAVTTATANSTSAKLSGKTSCQALGTAAQSSSSVQSHPIVVRGTCTTN